MPEGGFGNGSRNDGAHGSDPGEVRRHKRLDEAFHPLGRIADTLPDAMALTRAVDHVIIDVNANFETMIGWSRDEAIGKTARELALWPRPEDREAVLRAFDDGHLQYVEQQMR